SKADCEMIKKKLSDFISETLKMELSDEKTLITHSNTYARFLGYDVRVRRSNKLKKNKVRGTMRTLNGSVELNIPLDEKIMRFLFDKKIIEQKNGKIESRERRAMLRCTEFEIVSTYNAELRGICNYYSLASNYCKLNYFAYLMEYSCLKTIAAKRKTTVRQLWQKLLKDGRGKWCVPYTTKDGIKHLYFADYRNCKRATQFEDTINKSAVIACYGRSTFESRLAAKQCELCGTTEAEHYEVHHINKIRNLSGKEMWEQIMIAKSRKTMVLCRDCHNKIHHQ
ncbi:MAG: group II intron reverse transcriptase/maturase, partial [Clostridia bacterium]|nr:group II intron reverse transcriptase/maturase [Clostridia bacterium]